MCSFMSKAGIQSDMCWSIRIMPPFFFFFNQTVIVFWLWCHRADSEVKSLTEGPHHRLRYFSDRRAQAIFCTERFFLFFAWLKTTGKVWWLPVISVKTAWCLRCELMENLLIERGFKRKMCLTFVKHNGKKGWQSSRRAPADVKCYHWPQMMGLYFQPMPWIILLSLKAFSFFFTILLNKISLLSKWSYFIPTLTLFYVISG